MSITETSLPISDAFIGMEAEKQKLKKMIKAARASELFKEPTEKNTPSEYARTKERTQKVRLWTSKLSHIFQKQGEEIIQLLRANVNLKSKHVTATERKTRRNGLEAESRRLEEECQEILGLLQELSDMLVEKERRLGRGIYD